jgi:hypothetical protein
MLKVKVPTCEVRVGLIVMTAPPLMLTKPGGLPVKVTAARPHLSDQLKPAVSDYNSYVTVKTLTSFVQIGLVGIPTTVFQTLAAQLAAIVRDTAVVVVIRPALDRITLKLKAPT